MKYLAVLLIFCCICSMIVEARQDYSACNLGTREMCTVIPSHFCCRKSRFRRIVRNKQLGSPKSRSYFIRLM